MRHLLAATSVVTLFIAGSLLAQLTQTTPSGSSGGGGGGAVTQSGTWSVRTQDGSGNPLASSTTSPSGTEQGLVTRNIPSGTQTVSGTVTANAAQSGTWTVQPGNTANSTPWLASISQGGNTAAVTSRNSIEVEGPIAHGSTGTAVNPGVEGCVSVSHGANPTAVAANAVSRCYSNRAGIPWVIGGHPNVVTTQFYWTSSQTDSPIVAVSSGLKIVVTRASITCSRANSTNVSVRLGFGTTTLPAAPADGATSNGILLVHDGIAAGSGVVEGVGAGILGIGGDGDDLRITSSASTGGSCSAIVSYYTVES